MKTKSIFPLLLILVPFFLVAQNLHLDKNEIHKPFYTHTQVDVNFLNYTVKNMNTNGVNLNVALVFKDKLATGLSFDITEGRDFSKSPNIPSDISAFEYTQFSWFNEIILHPGSRIDFSFPLKLGLGHAAFSNDKDFTFGRSIFSKKGVVDDAYFFVVEPGVNVMTHITHTIDLNLGGSYRLAKGAAGLAIDRDFLNYSLHFGFRFRISSKSH